MFYVYNSSVIGLIVFVFVSVGRNRYLSSDIIRAYLDVRAIGRYVAMEGGVMSIGSELYIPKY